MPDVGVECGAVNVAFAQPFAEMTLSFQIDESAVTQMAASTHQCEALSLRQNRIECASEFD